MVCDNDELKRRKKAAILALLYMFTGFGSKQARALPISRVVELIAAVSENPIPNLVHGSYRDYVERSIDALKAFTTATGTKVDLICYNAKCNSDAVQAKSLEEFFKTLIEKVAK